MNLNLNSLARPAALSPAVLLAGCGSMGGGSRPDAAAPAKPAAAAPAAAATSGSKFPELKIGMSQQQAISLLGQPNDAGMHLTGKAFIPFYFGSDRTRYEMVYKGQGRLLFATGAGFIHSATEGGTR